MNAVLFMLEFYMYRFKPIFNGYILSSQPEPALDFSARLEFQLKVLIQLKLRFRNPPTYVRS